MKRFAVVTASVVMMLTVVGCGGSSSTGSSDDAPTTVTMMSGSSSTSRPSVSGTLADELIDYEAGYSPYPPTGPDADRATSFAAVVTNLDTQRQAEDVSVKFKLYRDATRYAFETMTIPVIPPFEVGVTGNVLEDVTGVVRMEVEITVGRWTTSTLEGQFDFTGQSKSVTPTGGTQVTGTVTSTYPVALPAKVGLLLLDGRGRPVGYTAVDVASVPAGGGAPFSKTTVAAVPEGWSIRLFGMRVT